MVIRSPQAWTGLVVVDRCDRRTVVLASDFLRVRSIALSPVLAYTLWALASVDMLAVHLLLDANRPPFNDIIFLIDEAEQITATNTLSSKIPEHARDHGLAMGGQPGQEYGGRQSFVAPKALLFPYRFHGNRRALSIDATRRTRPTVGREAEFTD